MDKRNLEKQRRILKKKKRAKKRRIANLKFTVFLFVLLFGGYQIVQAISIRNNTIRDTIDEDKLAQMQIDNELEQDRQNSDNSIVDNNSEPDEIIINQNDDLRENEIVIDEDKMYDIDDGYDYTAHSMLAVDLSNDEILFAKNPNDMVLPASVAKLFVIDFATNYLNLDDIVIPSYEAINSVKQGSSMAYIAIQEYSVENLYAAMMVPSGNDAAYVIAEETGRVINPNAESFDERITAFFTEFDKYLQKNNYTRTALYDPSGFDYEATSSVMDIKRVTENLLKNAWFRNIISQESYSATLPYGGIQTWKNTNLFLDYNDNFYRPGVMGVKTGTVGGTFNLDILYETNGREYLIISLGSTTDYYRYSDVEHLLQLIDNSIQ